MDRTCYTSIAVPLTLISRYLKIRVSTVKLSQEDVFFTGL